MKHKRGSVVYKAGMNKKFRTFNSNNLVSDLSAILMLSFVEYATHLFLKCVLTTRINSFGRQSPSLQVNLLLSLLTSAHLTK